MIIDIFDGALIARGDLGVEMSLAKLPSLQKLIIEKCRKAKKPVIVATQMLDSMIENSSQTRAEVNDVANAVYEGVDAVMLSGETAMGKYPIEALKIMQEILLSTEEELENENISYDLSIELDRDHRSAIGESVKLISKLTAPQNSLAPGLEVPPVTFGCHEIIYVISKVVFINPIISF